MSIVLPVSEWVELYGAQQSSGVDCQAIEVESQGKVVGSPVLLSDLWKGI